MKSYCWILLLASLLIGETASAQFIAYSSKEKVNGKPKYSMGIGGWLKINGIYDFVGVPNESALNLPTIPVDGRAKEPYFSMDMYQTRIKFESLYESQKFGTIRAYIETDFYGSGGGNLRLRHAYVDVKNWRFGQYNTVLSDGDVWPDVIDFDGPVTGIWVRHVQLSWGKEYDNNTSFRLSLETPFTNYSRFIELDSVVNETNQNIPDLIARYRMGWKTGHVQLGGIFRSINYKNENCSRQNTEAWGFVFSSSFFKTARSILQLQFAYGEGIASYMVGFQGAGFDAAPDGNGKVKALPAYGGYAAGTYFWDAAKKWSTTAVFGYTLIRNDEVDTLTETDSNGSTVMTPVGDVFEGEFYAINLFYKLTDDLRVGVEYDYGTHENARFQTGDAGRIQFDLEYAF